MKDIIVKVPDKTVFIHVLIGVNEWDAISMRSQSNGDCNNLNMEFPEEGEQNE